VHTNVGGDKNSNRPPIVIYPHISSHLPNIGLGGGGGDFKTWAKEIQR